MACDFCEGKTCLYKGNVKLQIVDGELNVSSYVSDPWYNSDDDFEIRNCPMCGDKLGENDGD